MSTQSYKKLLLSTFIFSVMIGRVTYAEDYFNPDFIEGQGKKNKRIDLSVFTSKNGQLPGIYYTNVFMNNTVVLKKEIKFELNDRNELAPVLTKNDYIAMGILPNATKSFESLGSDEIVKNISDLIPDAGFSYVFNEKKLNFSVPQLYVDKTALGDVPQNLWDDGISTLFSNYYYSGSTAQNEKNANYKNTSYLNLRSGVNFAGWRYRNYSIYSHSNETNQWKGLTNYIERDVKSIRSHLTLGDAYTSSEYFDGFSFRGIKIASDDAMLPSSQRGFAPKVRGIAQTNAIVTIRQNGAIIRQENVSAGPFAIDDLYPTSTSGDLEVTVDEGNGNKRTYIQPFSSVPGMLREGNVRFSVSAGKFRTDNDNETRPFFLQPVFSYGISDLNTVYAGSIVSEKYKSFLIGLGRSFGSYGSLSLDGAIARSTINKSNNTGTSVRMQYAKDFTETGTNITLASYKYSTEKYKDFSEANQKKHDYYYMDNAKKDTLQLSINQNLSDISGNNMGSLFVTAYQQRYWGRDNKSRSFNFGYSNYYNDISYSVAYSYTEAREYSDKDQILSLNVSIPLGSATSDSNLTFSTLSDKSRLSNAMVGLNGSVLEDRSLNYNLQTGYTPDNRSNNYLSSSLDYKASFGEYQAGYDRTNDSNRYNYSTNGSIVVHPYGVTAGQAMGETSALVRAVDARDIKVSSNTGVYTNRFGYAIVPYVSPYSRNFLSLDTSVLNDSTEITNNIKTVVPTRGALVLADYPTRIGLKLMVRLTGRDIPFGAMASIENNGVTSTGIVDDSKVVYLSGAPHEGTINVDWVNGKCKAHYKLSNPNGKVINVSAICN